MAEDKWKIRTVRLDDQVWAAVKAMDCSLNQYLRSALLGIGLIAHTAEREQHPEITDPRSIPGVKTGAASIQQGFPCRCVHTGCRGSKFNGASRFANLCPECREQGHAGDPRNCQECFNDQGPT